MTMRVAADQHLPPLQNNKRKKREGKTNYNLKPEAWDHYRWYPILKCQ